MDSKGESSDQSYPNIFFIIDSYDEVSLMYNDSFEKYLAVSA